MFKITLVLSFGLAATVSADPVVFKNVKIRVNRSESDRRLVDKSVDLTFNDTARRLIVKGSENEITIAYDGVRKVVFDVTTHMRGITPAGVLAGLIPVAGDIAGPKIMAKHINDYWFYIEPTSGSPVVLEIPKESSPVVIEKAKAVFGDKVSEYPTRQGEKIEMDVLTDHSWHSIRNDKNQHPVPELRPDKALIVVVCPPLVARLSESRIQYKLHANDKVVVVNRMGTYSFAYLDPGEYLLVSQAENANGFKLPLEAGKDYYFLQNSFLGFWKGRTSLSQQSKEIVLHEMSGTGYADWKRK